MIDPHETSEEPVAPDLEAWLDRPIEEVLGIEFDYAPEEMAPPVDEGRLRKFIAHELSRDENREILGLVTTFRSWREALGRVCRARRPA